MGLFAIFRQKADSIEYAEQIENKREIQNELVVVAISIAFITVVRLLSGMRLSTLHGQHVLNVKALNEVTLYKEVFLAYLNAALLEPVLAIGGMEEVVGSELAISLFEIMSICWWIWLVTDAFDFGDVMQHYKFHVDISQEIKNSKKCLDWLRLVDKDDEEEKKSLVGSLQKDVALWFMLSCIVSAWMPGIVSHRDVMHAYIVVILWIVLHHSCRRATAWSGGYFTTFFFPSAALMPLEYCLPIMDVSDCVEDLDFLIKYRDYVQKRTGVELIIES